MTTMADVLDPLGLGRRTVRVAGRAGTALARQATTRLVDELLARGVADQVAERILCGPELERILEGEAMERFAERLLDSPAAERLIAHVFDSNLLDAAVTRVLASAQLWHVVEEVAGSPAVADAISRQGTGFADQVVDEVGERSRKADALLERAAHRIFHRPAPAGPAPATP
jgi:hypothetical protein